MQNPECIKNRQIRIFLADDHSIILQGLHMILRNAPDIEIVSECESGFDAYNMILDLKPDIAILDISMPGLDGLSLAAKIRQETAHTSIIFLTTHDDPLLMEQASAIGAKAYILKNTSVELILNAIRQVATGANLLEQMASVALEPLRSLLLTDREKEVLQLIANGLTNRMIAENLNISINTVDRHRSNLMTKLGLHSTAEMVKYAIRTGLI